MNDNLFADEMLKEFHTEASDLLDQAEKDLLLAETANYGQIYDSIFRVLHSLKGGAGMLGLDKLQKHMHALESVLAVTKGKDALSKSESDFFLLGVDAARKLLMGENVDFDYTALEDKNTRVTEAAQSKVPKNPSKNLAKALGLAYVIDDEPEILEIISDYLSDSNIETQTFQNSEELFAACKSKEPDLVLSDIKMPKISGIEVLQTLKRMGVTSPVILVSGFITKDVLLSALQAGTYGAIEKPFTQAALTQYCFTAIKQRQLQAMLKKSINLLLYQFSDLDSFLAENGKEDIAKTIRKEMKILLAQSKELKI